MGCSCPPPHSSDLFLTVQTLGRSIHRTFQDHPILRNQACCAMDIDQGQWPLPLSILSLKRSRVACGKAKLGDVATPAEARQHNHNPSRQMRTMCYQFNWAPRPRLLIKCLPFTLALSSSDIKTLLQAENRTDAASVLWAQQEWERGQFG